MMPRSCVSARDRTRDVSARHASGADADAANDASRSTTATATLHMFRAKSSWSALPTAVCPLVTSAWIIPKTALSSSPGTGLGGAPYARAATQNSVALSPVAASSAPRHASAPRSRPPRELASCPGESTIPPPPLSSSLSHARAACRAAARSDSKPVSRTSPPYSPDDEPFARHASKTRSAVPRTSVRRGTSASTSACLSAALAASLVSSAIAACISSASVTPAGAADAPSAAASASARSTSANACAGPARVAAAAITRHSLRAARFEPGAFARRDRCAPTASENCSRCASGSVAQSLLHLPYSMFAPKYCTAGSATPSSASAVSHAAGVDANCTRNAFAAFCCSAF